MARFRYKGPTARPGLVKKHGQTKKIRFPKVGGTEKLTGPNGPKGPDFIAGQDIGKEVTDWLSLLVLRVDPRFEEIV